MYDLVQKGSCRPMQTMATSSAPDVGDVRGNEERILAWLGLKMIAARNR